MKIRALLTTLLLTCSALSHAQDQAKIHFLGHNSIAVEFDNHIVLVDALYQVYDHWENFKYEGPDLNKLDSWLASKNKTVISTATHVHRDHFHPQETGKRLDNKSVTHFFGSTQAVESIKESFINEHRIADKLHDTSEKPSLVLDGLTLEGLAINHTNPKYQWLENTGIVMSYNGQTVVHLGDALNDELLLEKLKPIGTIDDLVVPVWFVMDMEKLKKVKELTKAKRIHISHYASAMASRIEAFAKSVDIEVIPQTITTL